MQVIGRRASDEGPTVPIGTYRARDGSDGAPVGLDCARPHAACVVGKRGSGKSNTLAVLAEGLVGVDGVVPVVVDPMGAFAGLSAVGARVREPRVRPDAVPPPEWPRLVGLDPTTGPGALVWDAANAAATLEGMLAHVADSDAPPDPRRVARTHLSRADSWGVFAPDGVRAPTDPTVLDLSAVPDRAGNAVVRGVAAGLYERRSDGDGPLPWLLVDEAHAFLDGVAAGALDTLLTRGRAPGVSLVLATQRPGALSGTAVSQADLLVAHRLTGRADTEALAGARGAYVDGPVDERLPGGVGEALVFDDATDRAHAVRVAERTTPHGGTAPRLGTGS
jgi:DNA helicase HerA-like ATPase